MKKWLLLRMFMCISLLFFSKILSGQCTAQVLHTSGTQTVGCTAVTVTANGGAGPGPIACGIGPFQMGFPTAGSFTFNFNPAIPGVNVGIRDINNSAITVEEVAFTVNGSFYPITNPGAPTGCQPEALITGSGTIGACVNCSARSWKDIVITEPMTSLTVEILYVGGMFASGVNFSLSICCPTCTTDAGVIAGAPQTICGENPVTTASATQTVLDADDLLQYILFSNPADTLGSILATSNTPTFSFNPATMQMGVTYYIAAIAGNNVGGNVDLTDICLDISNAIPVTWQPLPTVIFTVANPDVCAGGCTVITATFTGTAPFTLTYSTPGTGPVTQIFSGNTGTFQVCAPAGSLPGSFTLQATGLVDAWCTCP